jgi:nucleoside-diphosphate-sugar epimerase
MSSVLVLGGTSWLGGEIARKAMHRGHDVTCLARGEAGDPPDGVTFVNADRSLRNAYDEVAGRPWDMVVDVSWQPAFVRRAVEALGGTASHWTYVSSASIYADQSVGATEDSPLATPLKSDDADWEVYGEAKAACEAIVSTLPSTLIARAGLIVGPGDRSDRFGYWVSRFALAADGPVLVPDVRDLPTQGLDVRDLAHWLVVSAEKGLTGAFNTVGKQTPFPEMLRLSAEVAGHPGDLVLATPEWLEEHNVEPWSGPRSLPLWVPPSHVGMGCVGDTRVLAAGLERRPLIDTLRDTLEFEKRLGLDRKRRAGMSREDELALIAELRPPDS